MISVQELRKMRANYWEAREAKEQEDRLERAHQFASGPMAERVLAHISGKLEEEAKKGSGGATFLTNQLFQIAVDTTEVNPLTNHLKSKFDGFVRDLCEYLVFMGFKTWYDQEHHTLSVTDLEKG